MTGRRRAAEATAALLVGFGLGVWFGSERTVRRVLFYSDPANRRRIARAKRASRGGEERTPTA